MAASGDGRFLECTRRRLQVRGDMWRCALAEWFGTTLFVWAGTSTTAQATLSRGRASDHASVALGWGIAAVLATLVAHRTSGGHLNPAISFFYLSVRQISIARFVVYTIAQLTGAFIGSVLTYLTYYDAINAFEGSTRSINGPTSTAHIFATYLSNPHLSVLDGVMEQAFGAAFLMASLATIADRRNRVPTHAQPPLVGAAYALIAAAFSWQSGGVSVNPARDLGARFFSALAGGYGPRAFRLIDFSQRNYLWFLVPLIAPMAGALLGGWVYLLTVGLHVPNEIDDLEEKVRRIQQHDQNNNSDSSELSVVGNHRVVQANPSYLLNNNNGHKTVLLARNNHKNNDGENNNNIVRKTSDASLGVERVPRIINDSVIYVGSGVETVETTITAEPRWHYNGIFADSNYMNLSEH